MAIGAGLARIAPYYLPDGGVSEAVMDHIYAATQIGGVIIARRMRRNVVPFPSSEPAPVGPTYEPPGAA